MGSFKSQKVVKILFLINNLKIGGAENVFVSQANYFYKQGIDVDFGVLADSRGNNFIDQLKIGHGLIQFKSYLELSKFIKSENIRVVYATLDKANNYARAIKIFNPNIFVAIRESGMADRKTWKIKLLDFILNFFVDKIIAVSKEVRQSLVKYQKIHAEKIIVLANGVKIMDEAKVDHDVFTILNIGSMNNDNKGQAGLIKLISAINLDLKLVLIGDGALKSDLENLAKNLNIQDKIIFTGNLAKSEVNKYYLASDLYILNSKNEGCPNVVLEAMSYGLPVIATRVGGVSGMIEDRQSGFLVNRGDYDTIKELITRLYQDKNLRDNIRQAAKNRIKNNFDFNLQTDKLIKTLLN